YACGGGEQPQKIAEVPDPGGPGGFEEGQGVDDAVGTEDDATQQGQAINSGDEPPAFPTIDMSNAIYLPYIESLEIPGRVIENEPFFVTLRISTQLKPELLNGLSPDSLYAQPEIRYSSPSLDYPYVALFPWLRDGNSTEPPVSELTVEVPGLPRGTWKIMTYSATSPEWGGASSELPALRSHTPYTTPPKEGELRDYDVVVQLFYDITVLPAEPE
ncbi:hypothetical protein IIA79_01675, partial [bacterium]|nr:hypothetical protein [bacterium]